MRHFINYSSLAASLALASTVLAQSTTCGTKGYDKSSSVAFFVDPTATTPTLCQTLCVSQKAQSFAVSASTCYCYSVALTVNLTPDPTAPNTFFDIGCNINAAPSSTSSSAAPATTTSTAVATTTTASALATSTASTTLITSARSFSAAASSDCTDEITLTVTSGRIAAASSTTPTITVASVTTTTTTKVAATTSTTALATPTGTAANANDDDSEFDDEDEPENGATITAKSTGYDPNCVDPTITITATASATSLAPAYVTEYATAYTTVVVHERKRVVRRRS